MNVIDYSFHHILASKIKPRVVVVIAPHKFDVVEYLYKKYNDKVDLVFVFQKADQKEIVGAVRSAEHLFGDKNIVLMPNMVLEYKDKKTSLIDKVLGMLDRQPSVLISKSEASVSRLKVSSALRIEDGKVLAFENKPTKGVEKYNALCVTYGFKKQASENVISAIEQLSQKRGNSRGVFEKSSLFKTSPVFVEEFVDIGTWTHLNAYLLRQYLVKSGIDPQFLKINQ